MASCAVFRSATWRAAAARTASADASASWAARCEPGCLRHGVLSRDLRLDGGSWAAVATTRTPERCVPAASRRAARSTTCPGPAEVSRLSSTGDVDPPM